MIILLCGFMGAGKTTLLKKLSQNNINSATYKFLDLDDEIIKTTQFKGEFTNSIEKMVQKAGWEFFRDRERELLLDLINNSHKQSSIVSLGGGALTSNIIEATKAFDNSYLVWVNTPFNECLNRLEDDKTRPLIKKGREYLKKLFDDRQKNYSQCEVKLGINDQSAINSVNDLLQYLRPTNDGFKE
ncbi:MAG: AAA family ATPase [Bacteriovoracaceae bacterium]|nr:AAA family ATPase [Bacteriovoracaceae bacterium]